jgi:3D-(3,5/4)-trihydroxycyclohexane-1,2-dione acylhydrolase (decyclizing)
VAGTRRLTVAQALVEFLANQHVERDGEEHRFIERVLGIFGHGMVAGLGEALEAYADVMPYQQARNEQGMVHTAIGYAKRARRLRTLACASSIGPGATNMITGAATATIDRIPVLLLPGDIFVGRRVAPVLQQLERSDMQDVSVNDCFKPVARYWDRISRPEQLITSAMEALRVLTSPSETGAVVLALPQDAQVEAFDYPEAFLARRTWHIPRPRPDAAALARAADVIASAERPLLVAGGGVIYADASAALDAFVRATGIPVAETQAGKGALPWDHPQVVGAIGVTGGAAANSLARDADVVIAVGTRLADFTTMSKTVFADPGVRFVSINVTEMDAHKHGAVPLVGDARAALDELGAALASRGGYHVPEARARRIAGLREAWNAEVDRVVELTAPTHVSQAEVIGVVNRAVGPDAVLVNAAGSLPGDLHKLWRTSRPGGYHMEYGYSCMGYEVAAGLGVKMATPDADVVVMIGDGTWLMLASELMTAVQEGRKLTIVLVDNHGYACIGRLSGSCGGHNDFNGFRFRDAATGLLTGEVVPVDFAANARSLGADVLVAHDRAGLEAAVADALASPRTTVVVVETDASVDVPGYDSWWDVPRAEVSSSPRVRAARADWESHVRDERWHL